MKKILFTFIITSLFWIYFYRYSEGINLFDKLGISTEQIMPAQENKLTHQEPAEPTEPASSPKSSKASPSPNIYANAPQQKRTETATTTTAATTRKITIVGKWQPVEGAEHPLEFTKYGTVIQTDNFGFISRYAYSTTGNKLKIRYDDAQFKLLISESNVYLEIYNSTDFSGRYKFISQPKNIDAATIGDEEYKTLIVGKWIPVDGQTDPLEFTKFGTVIQTDKFGFDSRYDYTINADRLTIRYDKNAHIVISEDTGYYYLEIYNTTDFSGRYRKKK